MDVARRLADPAQPRANAAASATCASVGVTPVYRMNCCKACNVATSAPVMQRLPASRAARRKGVSGGYCTTSKAIVQSAIISAGKASASASAPVMPSGVTLISSAAPSVSSGAQR
ncbi:hypothetical protein WR25_17541 [Diploscapter pachys]|uniref:Uncharacterized protein n=1 Tax=Diploscapter pachys TaxID=2018661 RepID=A0A2A2M5R3_9BILA|nr:hypothetical protein WR25_17541 [Diploscapter pachys]